MDQAPTPTPDSSLTTGGASPAKELVHLVAQLPGVVWTTDRNLCFTTSHGQGLVELGLKQNQVVGMSLDAFFAGDPNGVISIAAHKRALDGENVTIEQAVLNRVFQSHVAPLRQGGQIIGTIGVAIDITERKAEELRLRELHGELEARVAARTADLHKANAALRQSEERYQGILNTQRTFIARAGVDRRLTYMNDAYREAFQLEVGDDFLTVVHPDHRPEVIDRTGGITTMTATPTRENLCRIKGEWRWVLWQTSIIRDENDAVVEIQAVGFDVHERHTAEEALRQSESHYRDSAEVNRRLLMELDHRVRNNLAGLISMTDLQRHASRTVGDFADAMLARLRGIAHVHHVLTERQWNAVELRGLISSLLQATHDICPYRIAIDADGPAVAIHADDTLPLANILVEWLTNSCKYGAHSSPNGKLRIHWETISAESVPMLRITWQETGGPPVQPPSSTSLGTMLVEGFATRELRGRVQLRFPQTGACHQLEFPYLRRGAEPSGVNSPSR